MLCFFAVALLATLLTGPLGYGSELYVVDRLVEDQWLLESLADNSSIITKKVAFPDWQEGDVVELVTAGSVVVSATIHHKETARRRSQMEKALDLLLDRQNRLTNSRLE